MGLLREEVPEYPRPAVREAIVNAVAHRNYALDGGAVDIRMYDDRIEIQSPGGLPGHVTVENMRHERCTGKWSNACSVHRASRPRLRR